MNDAISNAHILIKHTGTRCQKHRSVWRLFLGEVFSVWESVTCLLVNGRLQPEGLQNANSVLFWQVLRGNFTAINQMWFTDERVFTPHRLCKQTMLSRASRNQLIAEKILLHRTSASVWCVRNTRGHYWYNIWGVNSIECHLFAAAS